MGQVSSADHGAPDQLPDHRAFLDLPLAALRNIALQLDIEDRKSLALSCKPLCSIVRQLWSTVIVNILGGYDDPVPQGLSRFSGVHTMIWTAGPVAEYNPEWCSDWDNNQSFHHPDNGEFEAPNSHAIARLTVVNELLYRAINPEETSTPRLISLKLDINSRISGADLNAVLSRSAPPSFGNPTSLDDVLTSLLDPRTLCGMASTELIKTGMREFGSGFWKLPVHPEPEGFFLEEVMRRGAILAAKEIDSDYDPDAEPDPDQYAFWTVAPPSPSDPTSPDLRLMHALAGKWDTLEKSRFQKSSFYLKLKSVSPRPRSTMLPYNEITAGWFRPDKWLGDLVSRCSVDWCYHAPLEKVNFEPYAGKLKELRFRVNDCQEEERTAEVFQREICPRLNTLTSLQQLYLGRPDCSRGVLPWDPRVLQLPSLTRLVLNDYISFDSFEHLTHLSALESLSVHMATRSDGHPQDLSALVALPNLTSLSVDCWKVEAPQDVACLTKLTELSLVNLTGDACAVQPSVPMPSLIDVTLTKTPEHLRFLDDSNFAEWGLHNAATIFPNVEVLQLGPMGSALKEVRTTADLTFCVDIVDTGVEDARVLSKARNLRYLQLDCVLNIKGKKLIHRCEAGSMAPEKYQYRQWEQRKWERSVEYVKPAYTDVLVAEFHYCLA